MTGRTSRAERARMPLARDVVKQVAEQHGVCTRPVAVRRTDLVTGESSVVDVPCGATLAAKCAPCAERAKRLRQAQCREGWHLDHEPDFTPDPATDEQRFLATLRADLEKTRGDMPAGRDTGELDDLVDEVDTEIERAGMRGNVAGGQGTRRARSTRRRADVAELPRRKVEPRTVGKTFTAPDGQVFRPSLFVTLTLDTYGRVKHDGTPVDPDTYDYRRAARDTIHFGKLVDRFVQNLRRFVGFDVQYFATVEPQRRLAPHLHLAMRGTVSRAELRQVAAATYHQVWWPPCDEPMYVDRLPIWNEHKAGFVDPDTGERLPTWDEALDDLDEQAEPVHLARFGVQVDAQGVLAGSPQAARCIGYLTKYLTKSVDGCHQAATEQQRAHVDRLVDALRFEPCSPTCANWLRYGVEPRNPRPGMRPGHCKGKAHRREHLGYGGRRVLVSRRWSGKNLADHKADRRAWVLATLGLTPDHPEAGRYVWEPVTGDDPNVEPLSRRLLRAVAERARWRRALDEARARADGRPPAPEDEISATTGEAAA